MLNEWTTQAISLEKALLYISKLTESKFTPLFINAVVYMGFLSNKIYCLQMFNFDGQEDDQATYDLSTSWWTYKLRWVFSRGNCNFLSLPEACLFNVNPC